MNELNEQEKERQTHRWRADDSYWGGLVGGEIEQKGKRTHGHGQQCGDCCGEAGIRGLNGNEKFNKDYIIFS